jgi:hypothetical protein
MSNNGRRSGLFAALLSSCLSVVMALPSAARADGECVVLLHGLARTSGSMQLLADKLVLAGFSVANIDYPSREQPIETLAPLAIGQGMHDCEQVGARSVSFVTHSLGGILVRWYFSRNKSSLLHRVVMLGPPNQGSEVVDTLRDVPGFYQWNGPAGMQLGTDASSVPRQLGPVDFQLGVIAGTSSINLILSTFLPNPDDGKVSVASTRVEGMSDFITLPASHPFIMQDEAAIEQVIHFLQQGKFFVEPGQPVAIEE